MSDKEVFRTSIAIESGERRGEVHTVEDALVVARGEFTWIPRELLESLGVRPELTQRFIVPGGGLVERPVGFAIVRAAGAQTPDSVVFAEPDDLGLLGAP